MNDHSKTRTLADANEQMLANGKDLTRFEQITQARRHTLWARQWTQVAMNHADPTPRADLSDAAKWLRKARSSIEAAAD